MSASQYSLLTCKFLKKFVKKTEMRSTYHAYAKYMNKDRT